MPQVVQQGSLNTAALIVPDLYVQIVPPQNLLINGVPTGRIGVVGTASWGPVNTPVIVGNYAQYVINFGSLQVRKYDMGTHVATAVLQGAQDFRCVRVSDGTDAAATAALVASCLTLTALYSGTVGNAITATVSAGSKAGSFKITIGVPGQQAEVFDNLTGTGNAFWVAAAAAINYGVGVLRGRSQFVVASAGGGTTAPGTQSVTLSGGSDGATTITATTLVGSDSATRTGMYSLRGLGCAILDLADADDATQWTTIDVLAQSEGMYAVQVVPAGTGISAAATAKATAGLDSYSSKLMHGDWLLWADNVSGLTRLVSPQGFVAGRLANLSPEQSTLNKRVYGVVGSQKSGIASTVQGATYSTAELTALGQAGIDVISNPQPGGNYWGCRFGHNSSSNASINGDNYTRLTDFIAATLAAGMGQYVGSVINVQLAQRVKATLTSFLQTLLGQGILGSLNTGLPFGVVCGLGPNTNNPPERTGLGYFQADVQVQYQPINEKFIVNLEGGQTVTINRQTLPSGQIAA